jgi:endonuclease/exonuclease/phosphatase family metal-dependent hydrolase
MGRLADTPPELSLKTDATAPASQLALLPQLPTQTLFPLMFKRPGGSSSSSPTYTTPALALIGCGSTVSWILEQENPLTLILAGDFNLHHPNWSQTRPHSRTSTQAGELVSWAGKALHFPVTTGRREPTHNLGGVLDLVWGSNSLGKSHA